MNFFSNIDVRGWFIFPRKPQRRDFLSILNFIKMTGWRSYTRKFTMQHFLAQSTAFRLNIQFLVLRGMLQDNFGNLTKKTGTKII